MMMTTTTNTTTTNTMTTRSRRRRRRRQLLIMMVMTRMSLFLTYLYPVLVAWQPGDGGAPQWEASTLPAAPVPDNPDSKPPPNQPPSAAGFDLFPGYENVGDFG